MKIIVNKKETGEKLKELRISNNLTFEDTFKLTGIKECLLKDIEDGTSNISTLNLVKLCNLYNISIDKVLCYSVED